MTFFMSYWEIIVNDGDFGYINKTLKEILSK